MSAASVPLKFRRLSDKANLPRYAHPGEDACFDLCVLIDDAENEPFRFIGGSKCAIRDADRLEDTDGLTIGIWLRPGDSVVFKTGLACELPSGYVLKVYARSSTGIKNHLMLSNGTGIIDSGYRGQIHISLTNFGDESICIHDGDRVAQAEVCEQVPVEIIDTDHLSDTLRGTGGIGSTGK